MACGADQIDRTLRPHRCERQSLPLRHFHNFDMPRRFIFVALMLSMLMQAITLGSPLASGSGGQAALHALLHWAGLAHHHHQPVPLSEEDLKAFEAFGDLGLPTGAMVASDTCHQDQSPDSTQHVLMDGCLSGVAMIPSWPDAVPARLPRLAAPGAPAETAPATPFLEGLRRPPKQIA